MEELIKKAGVLIEALPYIREFSVKTFVIKYGRKAMIDESLKNSVNQDMVLMKYIGINPVIVHGGGPEITAAMEKAGMKAKFVNGRRVTDKATMDIVEAVLFGKTNKEIVGMFRAHGGKAVGLSGKNSNLLVTRMLDKELGFVGEIEKVHTAVLAKYREFIPVIAPIGIGADGQTYNINADDAAAALAVAVKAEKLILITDVSGVLKDRELVHSIKMKDIKKMIKDEVITGGMIPKVHSCMTAIEGNVKKAHIINGTLKHSLLLEIFTKTGIGTE
ncbi:MAG: acetylglutamate kinase, partial [Candidatus Firestonebacteria bacterium]